MSSRQSDIDDIMVGFSRLELSKLMITKDMLTELVLLMEKQEIDTINFESLVNSLKNIAIGSKRKNPDTGNSNGSGNIDASSGNIEIRSPASSVSSEFSFHSADNVQSPFGEYKFKTPVKTFDFEKEKILLKSNENKRHNHIGIKTKSDIQSHDLEDHIQVPISDRHHTNDSHVDAMQNTLLSPSQKNPQPQKPFFGAMPSTSETAKTTLFSEQNQSQGQEKENVPSPIKIDIQDPIISSVFKTSTTTTADEAASLEIPTPIFSVGVGVDSSSNRRRTGRKVAVSSASSTSGNGNIRPVPSTLFKKSTIPSAPTSSSTTSSDKDSNHEAESVPSEDGAEKSEGYFDARDCNPVPPIPTPSPAASTIFNPPSSRLFAPSSSVFTGTLFPPSASARSPVDGTEPMEEDHVDVAESEVHVKENMQSKPGPFSDIGMSTTQPVFSSFSATKEPPQTPVSRFSFPPTQDGNDIFLQTAKTTLSPTFQPTPPLSPGGPDIAGITIGLNELKFSLGSGLGTNSMHGGNATDPGKKKSWLQSMSKGKRRTQVQSQSNSTETSPSTGSGMDCSTGDSPVIPAPRPTKDYHEYAMKNSTESVAENTSNLDIHGDLNADDGDVGSQGPHLGTGAAAAAGPNLEASPSTAAVSAHKIDLDNKLDEVTVRMCALAEGYRKEGKGHYAKEEYERALDCFSKALQVAPDDWINRSSVLSNRAAAYMMLDRFVEAEKDCEVAAKLDPLNSQKVQARRARALLRLGHLAKAHDAFCYLLDNYKDEHSIQDGVSGKAQVQMARAILSKLPDLIVKKLPKVLLASSEELLQICPQMRTAQTFKAQALCQMQRWTEAKLYMERVACLCHESIQALYAHGSAQLPAPKPEDLQWVEIGVSLIRTNVAAAVQALLFMGPEMGLCYVSTLKNGDSVRNCCNDVMDSIKSVLLIITSRVGSSPAWNWVQEEERKIRLCMEAKAIADKHFRQREFSMAYDYYSTALRVDADATRLNAILNSNRAAASMSMCHYENAISDCLESIVRDPLYSRAYVRRARAYRAIGNRANSLRDYKRYLQFTPPPIDVAEVRAEMEAYEREGDGSKDSTRESDRAGHRPHCVPFEKEAREEQPESSQSFPQRENLHRRTSWSSSTAEREKSNDGFDHDKQRPTESSKEKPKPFDPTRERTAKGPASSTRGGTAYGGHYYNRSVPGGDKEYGYEKPNVPPPRASSSTRTGAFGSPGAGSGKGSVPGRDQKQNTEPADLSKENDPSKIDYYELMGLSVNASDRDVRIAYKRLALRYHPDKNKDPSAEDMFKAVTGAYSVLSDKSARKTYDHTRLYQKVCGGSSGMGFRR